MVLRSAVRWLFILLVTASLARAQNPDPEQFLGIATPDSFEAQQLAESIRSHVHGDLADAARIQRRLASYWAAKDNALNAKLCLARAEAAEAALGRSSNVPATPVGKTVVPAAQPEKAPTTAKAAGFQGSYYGMVKGVLHKWDFHADGTFLHETIAGRSGTSVRNSERGAFRLAGDSLELTITKTATAFATPGAETHGQQTTQLGGGSDANVEHRRMKLKRLSAGGIVLDGKSLKVRSW